MRNEGMLFCTSSLPTAVLVFRNAGSSRGEGGFIIEGSSLMEVHGWQVRGEWQSSLMVGMLGVERRWGWQEGQLLNLV